MRVARPPSYLLFLSFAALLCLVELWVVTAVWFPHNADLLALAVTADLTLGIPALYYVLLVRPRHSPAIALAPIFLLALVLAQLILPASSQTYLARVQLLVPLVEGVALAYGASKARAVVRHYRQVRPTSVYASDALAASLRHTFGASPLLGLLVTELSIPYYVVCGWFRRYQPIHPTHVTISYHRTTGYGAVLSMFTGLVVLETVGLHVLVAHWSPTVAWILTAASCYSLVWIIADYQAVRLHPLVLSPTTLYVRTGLRWRVDLAWTQIAAVGRATPSRLPRQQMLNAAVYGEPRLVLQLREPVVVYGLLGIQKQVRYIGLSVDDEARFVRDVQQRLRNEG